MKKTALVIMAAGAGSRFKWNQTACTSLSNGEIIMDYSIRICIGAGFNKIVFIIA